jgi:hypothetical protein
MSMHELRKIYNPRKSVTNIVKKIQAKEVFMNQMGKARAEKDHA